MAGHPEEAVRFDRALPAVPGSVPELRQELTGYVERLGLPREQISAVRLAVTEAVTNAVLHAYLGRDPGEVRVLAEPGQGRLVVRVIDDGNGMGPRHDSPGLGMGLPLIGKLSERVDLAEGTDGRGGTEVRMAFVAPGLEGAAEVSDDVLAEVLAALAHVGDAEGFDGQDIGALVDLLVPRLTDLCSVTLLDADGSVRRVAAKVARHDGEEDHEAARWMLRFPITAAAAPSARAVTEGETQFVEVDEAWIDAVSPDDAQAMRLHDLDLAWWAAVPLVAGGQAVGSVSVASRAARGPARPALAIVERAVARAGGLVATARLVDELRRTRRRFEKVLGALTDAVTVTDPSGKVLFANPAAALLLGAADVDEVLATPSSEWAARFEILDEDGRPVPFDALPNRRALAGETSEPMVTRSTHRATGRTRWIRTTSTMLDDEGPLVVSVMQDVTALRAAGD